MYSTLSLTLLDLIPLLFIIWFYDVQLLDLIQQFCMLQPDIRLHLGCLSLHDLNLVLPNNDEESITVPRYLAPISVSSPNSIGWRYPSHCDDLDACGSPSSVTLSMIYWNHKINISINLVSFISMLLDQPERIVSLLLLIPNLLLQSLDLLLQWILGGIKLQLFLLQILLISKIRYIEPILSLLEL